MQPGRTFIKTGRLAILLARSHSEADSDTQSGSGLDTAQDEYRLLWLGLTRQSLVIAREETHFRSFMACASCQRTHGPCKSHHATIGYLPLRFSSVTQVETPSPKLKFDFPSAHAHVGTHAIYPFTVRHPAPPHA